MPLPCNSAAIVRSSCCWLTYASLANIACYLYYQSPFRVLLRELSPFTRVSAVQYNKRLHIYGVFRIATQL
jgi:hypothetical protein